MKLPEGYSIADAPGTLGATAGMPDGYAPTGQDEYIDQQSARNQAQLDRPVGDFVYGAKDALSDVGQSIENLPGSMWQLAKDVAMPVTNPGEFWPGMGKLIEGGIEKLNPFMVGEGENEQYVDAAVDGIKDRWGSLDNAGETIKTDPAGAFSDIMGLGGILTPGKLGKSFRNASPSAVVTNTPGAARSAAAGAVNPEGLYQSAARFHPGLGQPTIDNMINTGLTKNVPVTRGGLKKAHNTVTDLNSTLDELIDTYSAGNRPMSRHILYNKLGEAKANLEGGPDTPADIKQLYKYIGDLEEYLSKNKSNEMSVAELQRFKKMAYDAIYNDKGQLKSNTATDEARRVMAQSAKEGVERAVPEARGINQEMGNMIELRNGLNKTIPRQGGNNLLSMKNAIAIPAAVAAGGPLAGAGAALGGALGAAGVKSRLAIKANQWRGDGPLSKYKNNTVSGAIMRQLAIEEARRNEEQ